MSTAYLVGFISRNTGTVVRFGVYGEERPTIVDEPLVSFVLAEISRDTYGEAAEVLRDLCANHTPDYLYGKYMGDMIRQVGKSVL